jgi:hypothetical protein
MGLSTREVRRVLKRYRESDQRLESPNHLRCALHIRMPTEKGPGSDSRQRFGNSPC